MKRLPRGHKAQIQGQRMFQTMYTAEQMREYANQPRQWQGLTDEEVGALTVFPGLFHVETPLLAELIRAVEAKLREKNA